MIPNRILSTKYLRKTIDNECRKYNYDRSKWVGNLLGNWGKKEICLKEIIGTPQRYQFENIVINGVECADEYLTQVYGEWRRKPPIEKQVTHHDYLLCDLHKPFQ